MVDAATFFANSAASMTTKTRNRLIVLFIFGFPFMVLFGCLISQVAGPLPPIQTLPNPNGYDDFVKAGGMLADNVQHYEEMDKQELRVLVATNSMALQLARTGLQRDCRVTLDYPAIGSLKELAQAFAAEGRLAEIENRTNDAINSYLDLVRMSVESARGGVIINALVEVAFEKMGTSYLQKLANSLDAKSCREIAASLEVSDSQKESWGTISQQEHNWTHRAYTSFRDRLDELIMFNSIRKTNQGAEQVFKKQEAKTRQLMIDLAARAYELDKGKPPANLADLVPDYLKAVPQNPLTGSDMVYSPR
jgi:hypothetical protein